MGAAPGCGPATGGGSHYAGQRSGEDLVALGASKRYGNSALTVQSVPHLTEPPPPCPSRHTRGSAVFGIARGWRCRIAEAIALDLVLECSCPAAHAGQRHLAPQHIQQAREFLDAAVMEEIPEPRWLFT
jgi:hypothetical protein